MTWRNISHSEWYLTSLDVVLLDGVAVARREFGLFYILINMQNAVCLPISELGYETGFEHRRFVSVDAKHKL